MTKLLSTLAVAGLLASSTAVWADTNTEEATEAAQEVAEAMEVEAMEIDEELAKKGKKVFKKCKACHKIGDNAKNVTGPVLNGVFGREVGVFEGFKYSKAMMAYAEGGKVWDEETLDAFLKKPKNEVPKTKMSFAGLKKEKDRKAIIEFMKSISNPM